jgi:sulfoxide reductase heme-binding subunit YedZ
MRFMVLVLAATPLARWGWPRLARYRRMLGLYAWFYATLHLLVFAQVYIGWSGGILVEELAERPYVFVGFLAWLILVPLGITSVNSIRRKMGTELAKTSQAYVPSCDLWLVPSFMAVSVRCGRGVGLWRAFWRAIELSTLGIVAE